MFARTKRIIMGAGTAVLLLTANAVPANAIAFNIDWTGSGGYTMTGMFSYSDALIGTGAIDETDIDSLMIEVFLGAASQGTWDWVADGLAPLTDFNFSFDTTTEMFLVGGLSNGPMGQQWNTDFGGSNCFDTGAGFISGNSGQVVCVDGAIVIGSSIPVSQSTLTATRKVPEPGTLALFGLGLVGLGCARRKRAV